MYRLLVLLVLAGCGYPMVPYSQIDEAIENAKTPEEQEYYIERREKLEGLVVEAEEFYRMKELCIASKYVWWCTRDPRRLERMDVSTIDGLLKKYNTEKFICGCGEKPTW